MKTYLRMGLGIALTLASAAVLARDVINLAPTQARAALQEYRATLAKEPQNVDALKAAGILLHQLTRPSPQRDDVEQGERYLKDAHQLAPNDAETAAWLGSIVTMKALFETDPGKQTLWVKVGARLMDGAVKAAPDNTVVRLVRANNSLELPPFLRRTRFAVEDFNHYLALCHKQSCAPTAVDDARTKLKKAQQLAAQQS